MTVRISHLDIEDHAPTYSEIVRELIAEPSDRTDLEDPCRTIHHWPSRRKSLGKFGMTTRLIFRALAECDGPVSTASLAAMLRERSPALSRVAESVLRQRIHNASHNNTAYIRRDRGQHEITAIGRAAVEAGTI